MATLINRLKRMFGRPKRDTLNVTISELTKVRAFVDADYYYSNYPDVREAGVDAAQHYFTHGWREGRNPSAKFVTSTYLLKYPELIKENTNPLLHFIEGMGDRVGTELVDTLATAASSEAAVQDAGELEKTEPQHWAHLDVDYYTASNPDLSFERTSPQDHYDNIGWKEGRDPAPWFNTKYYLSMNRDIADAGINPFAHYISFGRAEGRLGIPFSEDIRRRTYQPLVSVVVPNFNHARFLRQRIDSVLRQTYTNVEIILLDDCSTDESVSIMQHFARAHPHVIRLICNHTNSGRVFDQWNKGFSEARGQLVWICESDDFCDDDFLEHLVPLFADRSVMLAFGRIQFCDESGNYLEGLDGYRESAEQGIWEKVTVRSAAQWFRAGFGLANVIPNAGGAIFRNHTLSHDEWQVARTYRVVGDWYLYLRAAKGGRIAYHPKAVSYFRQHGSNTSVKSFDSMHYYTEHQKIAEAIAQTWGLSKANASALRERVHFQYERSALASCVEFDKLFDLSRVNAVYREQRHVLICLLALRVGGGEIFAIELANELSSQGDFVSLLLLDCSKEDLIVSRRIRPELPVYEKAICVEHGVSEFPGSIGCSILHSHYIGFEYMFLAEKTVRGCPYVVTLHGSYDGANISDNMLLRMLRGVSCWVYLAEKNLAHLANIPLGPAIRVHIPNGVAYDWRDIPGGRRALGIPEDAFVFVIASRDLPSKGWRPSILALEQAQLFTDRELVLLLCGDGEFAQQLSKEFCHNVSIRFMGFQDRIQGIFALADCVMLPSRYQGESFPLVLIQGMLSSRAIIASDVGHIGNMISDENGDRAGILIPACDDDGDFVSEISKAMREMLDDRFRRTCESVSRRLGERYSIQNCAEAYRKLYATVEHGVQNGL
jgi:glycosyltransferase involved in cell wall biosynthesis